MSVKYSEMILPDVTCVDFQPDKKRLLSVLETLEGFGWIRDIEDEILYQKLEQTRALVRGWNPTDALRVYVAGGASDGSPDEWPETNSGI